MSSDPNKSRSTFLTSFVPGLILGLVVGGLAGAFLVPVVSESSAVFDGSGARPSAKGPTAATRDERDESRTQPAPTEEKTPEEKPPEQQPPAPATPEPAPTEPQPAAPK